MRSDVASFLAAAACLVGMAVTPSSAAAQADVEIIFEQFESAYDMFSEDATYVPARYVVGVLQQGGTEDLTFELQAGAQYVIYGACDGDCDDVDLTVAGPGGDTLDSDVLEDAQPILDFAPPSSGTHRVRVTMPDCQADYCYYGVMLMARQ